MASWTLVLASLVVLTPGIQAGDGGNALEWHNLPELPHALGGQLVGVIQDHLVVAGGSYFLTPPWSGGTKQWVDTIYALGRNETKWQLVGHLPSTLGYGVAISAPQGMLCIGGQTPSGNSRQTLLLHFQGNEIVIERLADLPETVANMAGALAGDTVYIAGGQLTPTSTAALHNFWSLSLSAPHARWSSLPPWPGPPRIFPVMVASGFSSPGDQRCHHQPDARQAGAPRRGPPRARGRPGRRQGCPGEDPAGQVRPRKWCGWTPRPSSSPTPSGWLPATPRPSSPAPCTATTPAPETKRTP